MLIVMIVLLLSLGACATLKQQTSGKSRFIQPMAQDYARAERFRTGNADDKVLNLTIRPYWINEGKDFWYRRDTKQGHEFVIVQAATGERRPAFDHQRLAQAMAPLVNESVSANELPLEYFVLDSTHEIEIPLQDKKLVCDLSRFVCSEQALDKPADEILVSPAGGMSVFTRDDNLWLRDRKTDEERAVTDDGLPYFSYGKLSDNSLSVISRRRLGLRFPPSGTVWSPDSRKVVVKRLDERHLQPIPFVQYAPDSGSLRPFLHQLRYSLIGEEPAYSDYFVIDINTGNRLKIELPESLDLMIYPGNTVWSEDNRYFYVLASHGVKGDDIRLVEVDTTTGKLRTVIRETADTHVHLNAAIYSRPNVRLLGGGQEAIWYSERSGWGHLYLYDVKTGQLRNAITQGDWPVHNIEWVDEVRRRVFFSAGGRESGRNPYYRHIYRVNFDGSGLRLLTPEDAFHGERSQQTPVRAGAKKIMPGYSRFSPDGRYLIDTYSRVDQPPVTLLRSTEDGRRIAILEKADAGALFALGWQPPKAFTVKAADGKTDLYGALYLPRDFDPDKNYPVINAFYGGPQMLAAAHSFIDVAIDKFPGGQRGLAELGFIVMTLDSRGTIYRSRAFHEYAYENLGEFGLQDQIAGLRQLAERYPAMDLDRVGIYGHSFGGYGAARAILAYPDFFKVAVSSAGVHNFASVYHGFESLTGMPVYRNGGRIRKEPSETPVNFISLDNSALAGKLQGKLLLAWSELDENVPAHTLVPFIDALVKAGKRVDMLYLPNDNHRFVTKPYFVHRQWDYFVEHLMGATPPRHW